MSDANPAPEADAGKHAAISPDVAAAAQAILTQYGAEAAVEAARIAPTKSTKAVVGAIVSGIVALAAPLLTELADPHTDWSNAGTYIVPIVYGLVGAGLVGGGVYLPTNKAK